MTQQYPQSQTPTVTADWRAVEMPGQYQALMALLFGGTGTTQQASDLHTLASQCDTLDRRVTRLETDAQNAAA